MNDAKWRILRDFMLIPENNLPYTIKSLDEPYNLNPKEIDFIEIPPNVIVKQNSMTIQCCKGYI